MHEQVVQGITRFTLTCLRLQLPQNARATVKPLVHGAIGTQGKQARTCHWAAMDPLGRCASVAMWL